MITMGIDPGITNLGWAILDDGKYVCSGCCHFAKDQVDGYRLQLIYELLRGLHIKQKTRFTTLGIERCVAGGSRKKQWTPPPSIVFDVGRVTGVVEEWCYENGVTMLPVSAGTMKKHATGDGRADKKAIIAVAEQIKGDKILVKDSHEADAICIAAWAETQAEGK